jgi:hypothetical protein
MKKLLAVLGVAAVSALAFGANAFGDTGSSEPRDADGNQTNQVDCGTATADAGIAQVNAGGDPASGGYVEVCNDGTEGPVQGSIYAQGSASGGSAAADGDADNPAEAQGWAGAGSDGSIGCGPEGSFDSRTDSGSADLANCG